MLRKDSFDTNQLEIELIEILGQLGIPGLGWT